jgi:hypothetical protein
VWYCAKWGVVADRQVADLSYKLTVLGNACLDRRNGAQRVLLEEVFTVQAKVLRGQEWVRDIRGVD